MTKTSGEQHIEYVPSKLLTNIFQLDVLERKITCQVIKMKDSVIIYVNENDTPEFNNLALAMKDRYSSEPISTVLVGDFNEDFSKNTTSKLCKKLNKVVFLSCNVSQDRLLMPLLEKQIYEKIKSSPDMF
ncbi:unnamed protein product [Diabrotica balteata]|uniref:Proteasome assembly chaperone 4 n=1 Tax=Diabrotica balteata TaxID=107213 RepID=A0A9N9T683_DIABA|nr:unnamed protein product [Diabrotica balteata]